MRITNAKLFAAAGTGALVAVSGALTSRRRSTRRRAGARVADAMTGSAVRVDRSTSVHAAAARMAEEATGAVAVCDGRGDPLGVLTDRDLVVRWLAQGDRPDHASVSDYLEGEAATVDADASLEEAAQRMRGQGVRQLPVLRDGRLAGMLTLADLAHQNPRAAASVHRALNRQPADTRSAAWLFRRAYSGDDQRARRDTGSVPRVAEDPLTEATRAVLADRAS